MATLVAAPTATPRDVTHRPTGEHDRRYEPTAGMVASDRAMKRALRDEPVFLSA